MSDLIERQAAIDVMCGACSDYCDLLQVQIDGCDTFISWLLPLCPLTGEKNDEERHRL